MAIRDIVLFGEDCLRKKCKPIDIITKRIETLAKDMVEPCTRQTAADWLRRRWVY